MANKTLTEVGNVIKRVPGLNRIPYINKNSIVRELGVGQITSTLDQALGSVGEAKSYNSVEQSADSKTPSAVEGSLENKSNPYNTSTATSSHVVNKSPRGKIYKASQMRAGHSYSQWQNPYIQFAMPSLLKVENYVEQNILIESSQRSEFITEIKYFRERLSKAGCDWTSVTEASYLLCTFIDELVNSQASSLQHLPYGGEHTLLVEFHGDAWGGEDAFVSLSKRLEEHPVPMDLLGFYDLILSLGWKGRYAVIDRGQQQLEDLHSRLSAIVWQNNTPGLLGPILGLSQKAKSGWWTLPRMLMLLGSILILSYLAFAVGLYLKASKIRADILAWTPPVSTIDIRKTLPPPLPEIITEGWLTAYKNPQGWLLVFKSDGAFEVGSADIRPSYLHNIERLGKALAQWPGDLEVIGHTDSQPIHDATYQNNQALSEARAKNVSEVLTPLVTPVGNTAAGTQPPAREVGYSGKGDSEPVDKHKTPEAYERNRRVEVLWKVN